MRILQVHNVYQQAGGEDAVVAAERRILTEAGHEVVSYTVSNEAIVSVVDRLRTAWNVAWSAEQHAAVTRTLADAQPDMVHVHNTFPTITPAVFDACRRVGVPVVTTLHNYRFVCAAATLMRNNRTCELCLQRSPYWGAVYGCYRGSRLGSLAVAYGIVHHRRAGTWRHKVDRFIVLTEFQKQKMTGAGLPAGCIAVKPNFLADPPPAPPLDAPRHGALFVGRLSPEKGVNLLLEAWREIDYPLRVVGDGPLEQELRTQAPAQVEFLGARPRRDVLAAMRQAAFLVMPSLWYEGLPMTLVEAYASDLPVVTSRLGALAELVEDGVTGHTFPPSDAAGLRHAVRTAIERPVPRGGCRRAFDERYAPAANLAMLEAIYAAAAGERCGAPARIRPNSRPVSDAQNTR